MKVMVFSYKMNVEPAVYHFPIRKYGSLTKDLAAKFSPEKSRKKNSIIEFPNPLSSDIQLGW